MSFNLFSAPTKDDIKVGYVDPTLGYVDGVSICEANDYAKNNPGTTFVFRDGDNNIRYLSINEVNRLTPNDLVVSEGECAGIQEYRECGPPRIQFFGGGGVGAAGNPIIGRDGSLLAVDIITGGYGYQYPPIVAARDDCQIGNGAVLTAVLGETADEVEVFEGEEDFEEYELCEDTDVGYGKRYGPDGEELGPWEPQTYTRIGADPIQREIEIFQRALKKPFWTTRTSQPDRVYTIEKSYATQDAKFVTRPEWGEFMNQYAVSPVKPSDLVGSDEAGRIFSMEWELNFPISGEYIFRGVGDDTAQVFVDGNLVGDLKSFNDNPSALQKTISEGNHIVKIDLLNILQKPTTAPTTTTTTTSVTSNLKAKFIKQGTSFYLEVEGTGSGEINFVMDVDDNPNFAGLAAREVIIPSDGGKVIFKRNGRTESGAFVGSLFVPEKETIKEKGKFTAGKKYGPIQIVGAGAGARGPIINNSNRLGIRDADGDDENIKITIASIKGETTSTSSTTSTAAISGATRKKTEVTFKISEAASDDSSIEIVDLLTASKDEEITRKLEVGKVYQVIAKPNDRKLRADGKVLRLEDSTDNDFNDLVIKATNGKFFDVNRNRCKFVLKNSAEDIEVISSKSWNQNPMGVSMTIDAPLPPVPQEQPPEQIGRCPPNPIWTTRFPGSSQKWYPVRFSGSRTIVRETISTSTPEPVSETQEVKFSVFGEGRESRYLSFTFTAVDGQHTFKLDGADKSGTTRVDKISIRKNVNYVISVNQSTNKKVEQGLIKEGTKRKEGGIGESNRIFADAIGSTNDNDDIQVKANIGKFISSNKGKIGGRTTFDLTYRLESSPSGSKNTTQTSTKVFENPEWSRFMNRYAISPVLPLDTPGSDASGTTFSNSWQINLPYSGFYGVKGTKDDGGRILIDGKEISSLDGFNVNNPKLTKVYLEKGRHTITAEVFNAVNENQSVIDTKIFSTQDWRSPSVSPSSIPSNLKAKFIKQGTSFYLEVEGTGSGEINFVMDVDDNPNFAGLAAKEVVIPSDGGKVIFKRKGRTGTGAFEGNSLFGATVLEKETIKEKGKFTAGKKYGPIQIVGAGAGARGPIINNSNRLGIRDADGDDENIKITIASIKGETTTAPSTTTKISQSPSKNGVTYEGPTLFGHIDKRWSKYMNDYSVSPQVSENIGKFTLIWKNVNFPESGTYKFNFQADNNATLKVGDREIFKTSDFSGEKVQYTFNATPGKYDVVVELENIKTERGRDSEFIFTNNPMGVALFISKDVVLNETNKTPWAANPMGISAILIPPPCAKKIGGKGVVDRVIVEDSGNGYLPPGDQGPGYPVTLILDEVEVIDTGINYRCGEDEIKIFPDNGAKFSYTCDSFGRIKDVKVDVPGDPLTVYPTITIVPPGFPGTPGTPGAPGAPGAPGVPSPGAPAIFPEPTGVNASFRPVLRVVRDPILPPEQRDRIIQVTDLVGLKQTGYVDGRAYYGAVYYEEGIPYAGYYKTAGLQTRVYATLQESITARVTTPASAIQRSGTDITSNDPRLNIPGTIQDTET